MHPVDALRRIAYLHERQAGASRRSSAFRRAADAIDPLPLETLHDLAANRRLRNLTGVGVSTEAVIREALAGGIPARLVEIEVAPTPLPSLDADAMPLRHAIRGDCHVHSEWSDGTVPIAHMAYAARDMGHEYIVLTDHSPRLQVANGLSAARLEAQLDEVAVLNRELAPFRVLTGIETDILSDGRLDQRPDLLARLDIVVASVHSKLRMPAREMTARMLTAIQDPNLDILGHCTGRMRKASGDRPESEFDADAVFETCARHGKAVEINARIERRDPPRRLLESARDAGCLFAIDTDAHAPGELEWLPIGVERAAAAGIPHERIVNTWPVEELLGWAGSHDAS